MHVQYNLCRESKMPPTKRSASGIADSDRPLVAAPPPRPTDLRGEYRKLLQEAAARHDDDDDDERGERADRRIGEMLQRTEDLFDRSCSRTDGGGGDGPGGKGDGNEEMALDAAVFKHISRDLKNRAQGIKVNEQAFRPAEFALKIAEYAGVDLTNNQTKLNPRQWLDLGVRFSAYFRRAPSLSYIYGSIDHQEGCSASSPRKKKPEASASKKAEDARLAAAAKASARPTRVTRRKRSAAENNEEERVINMVNALYGDLKREWRKRGRAPICMFEFLVDPNSFAHTCENIFHASFLVQERKVGLIDDDGTSLPMLVPLDVDRQKTGAMSADGFVNDTRLLSLSMEEWRHFVEIYELKTPCVKRTADPDDTTEEDDEDSGDNDMDKLGISDEEEI